MVLLKDDVRVMIQNALCYLPYILRILEVCLPEQCGSLLCLLQNWCSAGVQPGRRGHVVLENHTGRGASLTGSPGASCCWAHSHCACPEATPRVIFSKHVLNVLKKSEQGSEKD